MRRGRTRRAGSRPSRSRGPLVRPRLPAELLGGRELPLERAAQSCDRIVRHGPDDQTVALVLEHDPARAPALADRSGNRELTAACDTRDLHMKSLSQDTKSNDIELSLRDRGR